MNIPSPSAAVGWFPAFTLLVGFATANLVQFLQHRGTLTREREARREARRERLAERRVEFQRQTLLDLQEAVQDLVRATGATQHQDEMAYRSGERRAPLSEDLDQGFIANRRLILLTVRVRDQSLREMVAKFRGLCAEVSIGLGPQPSMRGMMELAQSIVPIHDRVGELLRTLDDEEDESIRN